MMKCLSIGFLEVSSRSKFIRRPMPSSRLARGSATSTVAEGVGIGPIGKITCPGLKVGTGVGVAVGGGTVGVAVGVGTGVTVGVGAGVGTTVGAGGSPPHAASANSTGTTATRQPLAIDLRARSRMRMGQVWRPAESVVNSVGGGINHREHGGHRA